MLHVSWIMQDSSILINYNFLNQIVMRNNKIHDFNFQEDVVDVDAALNEDISDGPMGQAHPDMSYLEDQVSYEITFMGYVC